MGMMSRARVLGYRTAVSAACRSYIYLPASRRRRRRRITRMGHYTQHSASVPNGRPPARLAAEDPELATRCPALHEYLTEQLSDEGVPRVTSTLQLSCEDGLWKAALTDRAQKGGNFDYKLWRSGESLLDALRSLDEALQGGRADWRKFPKWSAPKRG